MIDRFVSNLICYLPKYYILHFYSTYKKVSYLLFKDDHRLCFKPDCFPTNHLDCLLVQKSQFCIFTVPIKIIIFVFLMINRFVSNLIFYLPKYSILHFYSTYKKESCLLFKDDHRLCFQTDHFPANHLDCLLVQKVQFCIFTVPIKIIIFVF